MHISSGPDDVTITGANLRIVNGVGSTDIANGVGNLIVGYDESRQELDGCSGSTAGFCTDRRTGSHDVVVGRFNNFSSFGRLVIGEVNEISGRFSSVSGGGTNTAVGDYSSVSGGGGNAAFGKNSSISAGVNNRAIGFLSSVIGGLRNEAFGLGSTMSGGTTSTQRTSPSGARRPRLPVSVLQVRTCNGYFSSMYAVCKLPSASATP
ncbi:MAG TPA: hypothetical protein VKE96_22380, partial [Vicinamibacterales bacterium]|nr:hypothetical protein [Vicinamibacterales bacterium]